MNLALGTAQLGLDYGIANKSGKPPKEEALAILRYAHSMGVDYLDTAPEYGDSERIIGIFLKQHRHLKDKLPNIITKLPKLSPLTTVESIIRKKVETSLNNLEIDKLHVYLLHHPGDIESYHSSVLTTLLQLKKEGLIQKIGVSVYTPDDVKKVLEIDYFEAIQVPLNVLDHRLLSSGLLDKLANSNITVFARSVYLQGLILQKPENVPISAAVEPLKLLNQLCSSINISPEELSMRFVKGLPDVHRVIVGCETMEQLEKNIQLCQLPSLDTQIIEKIRSYFDTVPEEVIDPRKWIGKEV